MSPIRSIVSMLLFSMLIAASPGQPDSVWIGTSFSPSRCVSIEEGRHEVKRKLCTITYDIRMVNTLYQIEGQIEFNEKFVLPTVNEVELEVLLIDDEFVCRKQLNMRSAVEDRKASFSFVTENISSHRYVRTYYVVHYR